MRIRAVSIALVVLLPAAAMALRDPTASGRHPVGFRTMEFTKTSVTRDELRVLDTWIWYPAKPGTGIREATAVGSEHFRDADVIRRRLPLVLFSHGLCGQQLQSLFLMEALASWGFVVAAPSHPGGHSTDEPACRSGEGLSDTTANRPYDMQFLLDAMLALRAGDGPFRPKLRTKQVGMTGHSFGGQTVMETLALDRRFRAGVSMAPFVTGDPIVTQPTMIMGGELDSVLGFDEWQVPAYERLDGPRFLVEVLQTGHCGFAILCVERCGAGCPPEGIDHRLANELTLRYAVPFLLRYVTRKAKFGRFLKEKHAPEGVRFIAEPKRR